MERLGNLLTAADLAVAGLERFDASWELFDDGTFELRVEYLEGKLGWPFHLVNAVKSFAKLRGATQLKIVCIVANLALFQVLERRFGLTCEGSYDVMVWSLS